MTTREHLEFYARAKGIVTIKRDVGLVMERTGLTIYEHRLAAKLSGGNRRKLSLAIAILGETRRFCSDECTLKNNPRKPSSVTARRAKLLNGRFIKEDYVENACASHGWTLNTIDRKLTQCSYML